MNAKLDTDTDTTVNKKKHIYILVHSTAVYIERNLWSNVGRGKAN